MSLLSFMYIPYKMKVAVLLNTLTLVQFMLSIKKPIIETFPKLENM